jgi:hypothetical protein
MSKGKKLEALTQQLEALKAVLLLKISEKVEEEWLDSSQMMIQFHFSESKLYRLRKERKIPFTKIGGRYHYPKSKLNAFLIGQLKSL